MTTCKFCSREFDNSGSRGRVYCSDHCKEANRKIAERVRQQNLAFEKMMGIKCKTCKKKLSNTEKKYCASCIARQEEKAREREANGPYYRPCKECSTPIKNPAPNKKWCDACSAIKKEKDKVIYAKRKAEERAKERKTRERTKKVLEGKAKKIKESSGINPKFLVRGTPSYTSGISSSMGGLY